MAVRPKPLQEGGQNGGDQQVIEICLFLFPENGHLQVSSSISGWVGQLEKNEKRLVLNSYPFDHHFELASSHVQVLSQGLWRLNHWP